MNNNTAISIKDFTSDAFKKQMNDALPKHLTVDRMCRIALTELRKNPDLMKCNKMSFLGSLMRCCELGLEPSSARGHAFFIPYKQECTLVVGYKGLLQLAHQCADIATIHARCVYENDKFELEYGLTEKLSHIPAKFLNKEAGKFKAAYAVAHFKDGSSQFEVMFSDEIEKIRSLSPAARSSKSPWYTHYDEMAKKTVLRKLCKYLPSSTALQTAVSLDEKADIGKQKEDLEDILYMTDIDNLAQSAASEKPTNNNRAQQLVEKLTTNQNKIAPEAIEYFGEDL